MSEILITGAAGLIGRVLWSGLGEMHTLRGLDRRRRRTQGVRRGNVQRARTISRAFAGVDAVIDLATGARVDLPWEDALGDCGGRVNVLEAARANGVRRYIFASSNHVTGLYERDDPYARIVAGSYAGLEPSGIPLINAFSSVRPDSPYAVGKLFGEAASRFYAERWGLSCVCMRIGTVNASNRPTQLRDFATLLTHRDLIALVDAAVRAPDDLRFGVYYGVSANTWRFWDIENARRELGFEPQDNAERFRAEGISPGP